MKYFTCTWHLVSLYIMSFWPHKCCRKYNLCYTSGKTDQYHAVHSGVSIQTKFPITGALPSSLFPPNAYFFFFQLKCRIIRNESIFPYCYFSNYSFKNSKFLGSLFSHYINILRSIERSNWM